ncbi:MAG: low specificity L-threonine aldolase [Acidobacteria bacterium]|nr:low specificity L-threonine aldolase [Acidobacteriota bacterium]
MIDLRSDTVTKPTAAMRRAMAGAEVGDDVYQEDPTVNRLEALAAELTGKEAALFVPTGSMGNTIGVKVNTQPGQEVICEARSHVLNYELAMMAWFNGCLARTVAAPDGILTWDLVKREVRKVSPHWAPTGLIEIENTHNMAGGTVTPVEVIQEMCGEAHDAGLPVHMDGARVFNAAAYLGVPVKEITAPVDTVTFCLSKALGAPVGSLVCGTHRAMETARLIRKRLGGGMRQAGILAAAGIVALEQTPPQLAEDHANARMLARGLAGIRGISIDAERVQTNIVIFDVSGTGMGSGPFVEKLRDRGVLCNATGPMLIRFVTHYDVSADQCSAALGACEDVVKGALS